MEINYFNTVQFYVSWIFTIFFALWIAYEVYIWSVFMIKLKTWFFNSLIGILILYSLYSGVLMIYGIQGMTSYPDYFTIKELNWMQIQRIYIHSLLTFIVAILMRIVNYRSHRTSPVEKNIIYQAGVIIARSQKERARAELVEKNWTAYTSI